MAAALLHLLVPLGGPDWYEALGAPHGLAAMAAAGSLRPLITCVMIAGLLLLCAAYAFSALGTRRRLPFQRTVLYLIGLGLLLRGLSFPILAFVAPRELSRVCGQCESLNAFVIATSALCFCIGTGFLLGAICIKHER